MAYSPLRPQGDTFDSTDAIRQNIGAEQDMARAVLSTSQGISAGDLASRALDLEYNKDPNWEAARDSYLRSQRKTQDLAPRVTSLRDIGGLGDAVDFAQQGFASGVTSTLPSLAAAMALRGKAGYVGAAVPGYMMSRGEIAGSQYSDPELAMTPVEDRAYAASTGALVSGALESVVPGGLAATAFRKPVGSYAGNVMRDGLSEAATEAAQTGVEHLAGKHLNPEQTLDPMDLADAAATGFLGGGGLSAATRAPAHLAGMIPARQPGEAAIDELDSEGGVAPAGVPAGGGPIVPAGPADPTDYNVDPNAPRLAGNEFNGEYTEVGSTEAPSVTEGLKAKAAGAAAYVGEKLNKAKEAYDTSGSATDFVNSIFGGIGEDIANLGRGPEDASLAGATPEETIQNINVNDLARTQSAQRVAEALMSDESIPSLFRDRIVNLNGDYSSPMSQQYIHSLANGKRVATQMADALVGLGKLADKATSSLGDKLKSGSKRSNLQNFNEADIRPLVAALSEKLGPAAAEQAPEMARQLLAVSSRLSFGFDGDFTQGDHHLRNLSEVVDDKTLDLVTEMTGTDALRNAVVKTREIPNAENDVRQSGGNSFLESMLVERKLSPTIKAGLAQFVDTTSQGIKQMNPTVKNNTLKALAQAFGSPERAQTVLEYYGNLNRDAALRETDAAKSAPREDRPADGVERPEFQIEQTTADGTVEWGELTEKDGRTFQYGFRMGGSKLPFRKFGRKSKDDLSEGQIARNNAKGRSANSDTHLVPYSEYLDDVGVEHGYAIKEMNASLKKRIADHTKKLKKAQEKGDKAEVANRKKQVLELRGEMALLDNTVKTVGAKQALDMYEVLRHGERSTEDRVDVVNDDEIKKMQVSADKYPDSVLTFRKTNGQTLKLSAISMAKHQGHKRRDARAIISPNMEGTEENLYAAIAGVLDRDDIEGLETELNDKVQVRALDEGVEGRNLDPSAPQLKGKDTWSGKKRPFTPRVTDEADDPRNPVRVAAEAAYAEEMDAETDPLNKSAPKVTYVEFIEMMAERFEETLDGGTLSEREPLISAELKGPARAYALRKMETAAEKSMADAQKKLDASVAAYQAAELEKRKKNAETDLSELRTAAKDASAAVKEARRHLAEVKRMLEDPTYMGQAPRSVSREVHPELVLEHMQERRAEAEKRKDKAQVTMRSLKAEAQGKFAKKGSAPWLEYYAAAGRYDFERKRAYAFGKAVKDMERVLAAHERANTGDEADGRSETERFADAENLRAENQAIITGDAEKRGMKPQSTTQTDVIIEANPELLTVLDSTGAPKDPKWSLNGVRERMVNAYQDLDTEILKTRLADITKRLAVKDGAKQLRDDIKRSMELLEQVIGNILEKREVELRKLFGRKPKTKAEPDAPKPAMSGLARMEKLVTEDKAAKRDGVYYITDAAASKRVSGVTPDGYIYVNLAKLKEGGLLAALNSSPTKLAALANPNLNVTPEQLVEVLGTVRRQASFLRDFERARAAVVQLKTYPKNPDGTPNIKAPRAIAFESMTVLESLTPDEITKVAAHAIGNKRVADAAQAKAAKADAKAPAISKSHAKLMARLAEPRLAAAVKRFGISATEFAGLFKTAVRIDKFLEDFKTNLDAARVSAEFPRTAKSDLDYNHPDAAKLTAKAMRDAMTKVERNRGKELKAAKAEATKENRQSSQAPNTGAAPARDAAEEARIKAELFKILGPRLKVKFQQFFGADGSGSYRWSDKLQKHVINIATNAGDMNGVAMHEALHAFFRALGQDANTRTLRRDLMAAASSPYAMKKLRELLRGHPEAIKQIENDMEERAAYMFQFWQAGQMPELGQTGKNIFQRLFAMITEVLGLASKDERAVEIMAKLAAGEFSDMSIVKEVMQDMNKKTLTNRLEAMAPSIVHAANKLYRMGPDRLRDFSVPELAKLAEEFSSETGKLGFIQRRFKQNGAWQNRLADILEGTSATERRRLIDKFQSMQPPATQRERDLAKYFEDLYEYMDKAGVKRFDPATKRWVPVNKLGRYFPRAWDADYIRNHRAAWEQLLAANNVSQDQIKKTTDAIIKGDGHLDLAEGPGHMGFTPFASAVQNRQFTFINQANAAAFAAFQKKDLADVVMAYTHQAVHRAEYARSFGNSGEDIAKAVRASRLNPKEEAEVLNVIRGLEGTLDGNGLSQDTKAAMSWIMTAQNTILLPLAIFSQMIDPIILAARSGNLSDAGSAYVTAVKRLFQKHPTYAERMTKMMGIITADSTMEAMGMSYGSSYMSPGAQKINRGFFKYNGMQHWNDSMRIAAFTAGEGYMIDNRANKRALEELGLQPGDVQFRQDRVLLTAEALAAAAGRPKTPADEAQAARLQEAMFRFVDSAVIRPSASQRPTWMSDPRFMLIGHLKQFTFAMHNVVLKRAAREMEHHENVKPSAILLLTIPTILAADLVKMAFTGAPPGWGYMDYLNHAVQRSGLLGLGDFTASIPTDVERGKAPGEGLLGPSVEHLLKILRWVFGDPRTSLGDVIDRTIPGARYV